MTDDRQNQQETKQEVEIEDLEPEEAKAEEVKGGPGADFFIGVSG